MAIGALANFALRGFQAIFGIIILGLSVSLIKGHHWGTFPASVGYAAFVGGVTVLAALVGVAATWVSFLEGLVGTIIDAAVAIINVAGAIAMTIKLDGVKCDDSRDNPDNAYKLLQNDLFVGGCAKLGKETECWVYSEYPNNTKKIVSIIIGHCREATADMVFMYLATAMFLASALVLFLRKRKGY